MTRLGVMTGAMVGELTGNAPLGIAAGIGTTGALGAIGTYGLPSFNPSGSAYASQETGTTINSASYGAGWLTPGGLGW